MEELLGEERGPRPPVAEIIASEVSMASELWIERHLAEADGDLNLLGARGGCHCGEDCGAHYNLG